MIILFILQNAYKSEKYKFRNKREWYSDLKRSHSGKRLFEMIPTNVEIKVINSSLKIGANAKSHFKSDIRYIRRMIDGIKPDVICACGKVAIQGCEQLGLNFIKLPHPAWRQLSKEQTEEIKMELENLCKSMNMLN